MRRPTPMLAACALLLGAACAAAAARAQPAAAGRAAPEAAPRATPGCPSDEAVDAFARNLLANRTSPLFGGMTSLADGLCAQDKLVRILQRHWGRPVGYKLALTSAPVQQRFGVSHPIRGVIFEQTVRLRSGAEVPARFGAAPVVASDFLVRVRDDGINNAGRNPVAILRHLDQVIPTSSWPICRSPARRTRRTCSRPTPARGSACWASRSRWRRRKISPAASARWW
ncbi:hypothetical protein [Caldovatus aquaticus]|uniref:Uncharacterized protein n=1 Tax=Caldovatus aquaticus TaxID=2865671 RepID=A0ABS7F5D5_9PROT|nr:hypothetical protein [Caldovatus aquaticus]MBW8270843.1 hypothetical protein [Caldovatus aquaticus]